MTQFSVLGAQYEIAYRQERIAADFAAANGGRIEHGTRRGWRLWRRRPGTAGMPRPVRTAHARLA